MMKTEQHPTTKVTTASMVIRWAMDMTRDDLYRECRKMTNVEFFRFAQECVHALPFDLDAITAGGWWPEGTPDWADNADSIIWDTSWWWTKTLIWTGNDN